MVPFWNAWGRSFEILFEEIQLRKPANRRSRDLSGSYRGLRGCAIMEPLLI
jgi:hypothetical protein